MKSSSY